MNLGSISTEVQKLVPDVPSALSGTNMDSVAYQQLIFIQNWTGATIGSNSIDEKYQPAMIFLTASASLKHMDLVGADVQDVRIGDFSLSKGNNSNTSTQSKGFYDMGMENLRQLGRQARYVK